MENKKKKMDLIYSSDDENKGDGFDTLKVNEKFKERYEYNQRRTLLEQGKLKYGDKVLNAPDAPEVEESSSSDDDSDAELLNPRVEKKFLEVLSAIRSNDPKLLVDKPLFDDDDFDESKGRKTSTKKMTLKD